MSDLILPKDPPPLRMYDAYTDRIIGYNELLLGCGNSRAKRIKHGDVPHVWQNLTTLDVDPDCKPDVVHDFAQKVPLPFPDSHFEEIHSYECLEHCGQQGDFRLFFHQFGELWRVLRPDGLLVLTVPKMDSPWAFADPGHTRVLPLESFFLLSRKLYENEVGKTSLTDYRSILKCDFEILTYNDQYSDSLGVILKALKGDK